MKTAADQWPAANQRCLAAAVRLARARLALHQGLKSEAPLPDMATAAARAETEMPSPSALRMLSSTFGLSRFECDLLVLCAAAELDGEVGAMLAATDERLVTFALALELLPDAHWSAIAPSGPLRRLRLVDLLPGPSLVRCGLRVDERVLHYLTGLDAPDDRLAGLFEPLFAAPLLVPTHQTLAHKVAALWSGGAALVMLCGPDAMARRAVASAAAATAGVQLHRLRSADLPSGAAERESLWRLWERESLLLRSALLVEIDDDEAPSDLGHRLGRAPGLVLVSCRAGLPRRDQLLVRLDVDGADAATQRVLWQSALTGDASLAPAHLDTLVAQFNLSPAAIGAVAATLHAHPGADDGDPTSRAWDACRLQARARLDTLAHRIEPRAGWDQLVLPASELQTLRTIASHVRQRVQVYERWEFAGRATQGLGISTLFVGASGTGKTTAAEVLARELRLDLYRIDLSQVVSKYIGETEKNLRHVFDAAEESGAILLFDEADALFGRRSEVKDSHDRYANIEVSYLLQRMEAYRGLAILTSNLKEAIDTAFMRRLRMVVRFPFPDAAQRALIWERVFPTAMPREGIDLHKLARLHVPGGTIRNIALNAAFLAAEAGEPVRMGHLLRAAHVECGKTDKTLSAQETAGWV